MRLTKNKNNPNHVSCGQHSIPNLIINILWAAITTIARTGQKPQNLPKICSNGTRRFPAATEVCGGDRSKQRDWFGDGAAACDLRRRRRPHGQKREDGFGGERGVPNVIFRQLDARDAQSIQSLVSFIADRFQRLDILVNNAGASGLEVDEDGLRALNIDPSVWLAGKAVNLIQDVMKTTYDKAKECLDTNYYGVKNVTGALLPSLQQNRECHFPEERVKSCPQ